jgi:hypothetical protein
MASDPEERRISEGSRIASAVLSLEGIYEATGLDWTMRIGISLIEGRRLSDPLPVTNRRNPKLLAVISDWRKKKGLPPLAFGGT